MEPAPVPMAHIVGEIDHAGKVWKPVQPEPVQEPVAEVAGSSRDLHIKFLPAGRSLQLGDKLYTAAQPAPVPLTDEKKYRLLEHGEKIESGDTVLGDDCVTWHPLVGWEVDMQWGGHFMMPMRRSIEAAHDITEKGQP
jgi:hypothetical protein